jgi:hypothetical protein
LPGKRRLTCRRTDQPKRQDFLLEQSNCPASATRLWSSRRRVVASSRRRVVATEDIAEQGRLLRRVAETVDGGVLPAVVDEIYAGTLG